MKMQRVMVSLLVVFVVGVMFAPPAQAQFWDKVKERVTDAAEDETLDQLERKVRGAVRCTFNDRECIERAQREGEEVVLTDAEGEILTDAEGNPVTDPSQLPPGQQVPGQQVPGQQAPGQQAPGQQAPRAGVNANYDFEPGARTIFAEDFSSSNVGDFPRSLEFRRGSMEIVNWQGRRLLRMNSDNSTFYVRLSEKLPERFTIEFDFYTGHWVNNLEVQPLDASGKAVGKNYIHVGGGELGIGAVERGGITSIKDSRKASKQVVPIRVMVDGSYAKVYMGTERFANIPNADLARTRTLRFAATRISGGSEMYIGDIRIAAGGRDLYTALEAEGRVAVQDILFDTGKATIQPASAEALQEIATLLEEHSDLDLLIEGHTDNEGGFETNMALSKERAGAVKTYLVQNHGIDAARLKTIGLGATQPAASNDTEAGRAENRRVELVRL